MKNNNILTFAIVTIVLATSCKDKKKEITETTKIEVKTEEVKTSKITLESLKDSPAYQDAVLDLGENEEIVSLEKEVNFNFKIENYTLGAQTDSPNATKLANSGKGQHIHFILDNQPYMAYYENEFKKEIPEGTHHLVAFLSRSYHESVKNSHSVVVKKVVVGEKTDDNLNMEAPTLIYSRPKGTYEGDAAKSVLLDFFVLNTELSENGNKVKAKINDTEFLITEWAPKLIKGLPTGENTIELELVDNDGKFIDGPFNKVKRTITVK
jgi:hypothetical protein